MLQECYNKHLLAYSLGRGLAPAANTSKYNCACLFAEERGTDPPAKIAQKPWRAGRVSGPYRSDGGLFRRIDPAQYLVRL